MEPGATVSGWLVVAFSFVSFVFLVYLGHSRRVPCDRYAAAIVCRASRGKRCSLAATNRRISSERAAADAAATPSKQTMASRRRSWSLAARRKVAHAIRVRRARNSVATRKTKQKSNVSPPRTTANDWPVVAPCRRFSTKIPQRGRGSHEKGAESRQFFFFKEKPNPSENIKKIIYCGRILRFSEICNELQKHYFMKIAFPTRLEIERKTSREI